MTSKASKLVEDLSNIPEIVGALGLSISEAQKAFNLDYMTNFEQLVCIAKQLEQEPIFPAGATDPEIAAIKEKIKDFSSNIKEFLIKFAPPRYQFTETTLSVKLDLAQTMDVGGSAGFSVGYGCVALNAAMTVGYGYDYRAAAEVKTILHAEPADKTTFKALLDQADKFSNKALTLPERANVDKEIMDQVHTIAEKLTDARFTKTQEDG